MWLKASLFSFALALLQLNPNFVQTADGKEPLRLDDVVVYGNPLQSGEVIRLDRRTLANETNTVLFVREALELARSNPVQFDVTFAPKSAVITALGKERLDLLATGMRGLKTHIEFSVLPTKTPYKPIAPLSALQLARARAVVFYLKTNQRVANKISLPLSVTNNVRKRTPWALDTDNTLTVTLIQSSALVSSPSKKSPVLN